MYKEIFELVDEYVGYINDNYDISKLPSDERELIEYVIESMIKGIESDIDRHLYEFNLVINICRNSYRYFKIIDKIFEKLQRIYDESLEKDIISISDYTKMFREVYDLKIKTMVNDVHRTMKTEDEYLEYSKLAALDDIEKSNIFVLCRALESTNIERVRDILTEYTKPEEVVENVEENIIDDKDIDINEIHLDVTSYDEEAREILKRNIIEDVDNIDELKKEILSNVYTKESSNDVEKETVVAKEEEKKSDITEPIDNVRVGVTKTIRKVGRPRKNPEDKDKTKEKETEKKTTRRAAAKA